MSYEKLFDPINIGNVKIKNRYAMAPMLFVHDYEDGAFGDRAIEYYLERAKGGVGLIITSICKVDNEVENVSLGMPMPNQNPALFAERLGNLTRRMAEYNSKLFLQLTAGFGRAIFPAVTTGQSSYVAPSVISNRWKPEQMQRELTIDEIHKIVHDFGSAAKVAKDGGAAGVEIHALHEGYLLDQFSMSFYNQRTDEYGGSLENRLRFAKEIINEIHTVCGADFPVGMRFSLKSFVKDLRQGILPEEVETVQEVGRDIEEGLQVAKMLEAYGYAELNVDGGNYDSWYWAHPPLFHEAGAFLTLAEKVKAVVNIPVITAGMLDNPNLAENTLLTGKTDMIALGRPLIADSQIVNKIQQDDYLDVTPCQYCHEGCFNQNEKRMTHCTVNARAGLEDIYPMFPKKTNSPKKIAIIGAGPAGLESARLLALKGHQVIIYEKSSQIGGLFSFGVVPEFKRDGLRLIQWWGRQLEKLQVSIVFNNEIQANDERLENVDFIITSTGSTDFIPPVPGVNLANVHTAKDFLAAGLDSVSETITIIGAGTVGVELAIWLAKHGKKSRLIEMADKVLPKGTPLPNLQMMQELLEFYQVEKFTGTKLLEIREKSILVEKNAETMEIATRDVILALGYRSNNQLYQQLLAKYGDKVINLGDSNRVRDVLEAVGESLELLQKI